ncbi:MAG: RnfABCDGE type electron transport complex subunit G [Treponema sp.]|jgi:electron transport complex protein RnfG|nr:RnfABCDGE type electron transport complex subunit G [Treponema sp.]
MNEKEPGAVKLGLTLAVFAVAACVMLAFVYAGTEDIIEANQQKDTEEALKELFPGAGSPREITGIQSPDPAVTIERQYEVPQGGEIAGVALQVSRSSYGGPIKLLVGVSADSTITGVKILEHKDTPGLGANAASPSYTGQFTGKRVADPFKVKADVEAITAATITSRAVADAVRAAGQAAAAYLGGSR